jgi:hypothetical protein
MRTVMIELRPGELSARMAAMRIWLDERRFEPSSFSCHDGEADVLLRVEFKVADEADAFARYFGGSVDRMLEAGAAPDSISLVSRAEPSPHRVVGRAGVVGAAAGQTTPS